MYTQLVKIAEYGLKGEPEKVRLYVEHFVKMHQNQQHLVDKNLDSSLSNKFKMLLNNEEGGKVTMD